MTFKQALHRHLEALEIHEDAPGKRPMRSQSHLTLVYQRRGAEWVVVQDEHRLIK